MTVCHLRELVKYLNPSQLNGVKYVKMLPFVLDILKLGSAFSPAISIVNNERHLEGDN